MTDTTVAPRTAAGSRVEHPTFEQRVAAGKAARARSARSSLADFRPAPDRPDPISLLEEQAVSRVSELVPIRYGRMSVSPFTFFRGAALIMASDLAAAPRSGLSVQTCGDAHMLNFGVFASPERNLVFDLNDFDETLPGPWEWDVKRLAASIEIGGRDRGFTDRERKQAVLAAAEQYRLTLADLAGQPNLTVWYAKVDAEQALASAGVRAKLRKRSEATLAKARTRDSLQAFEKLTRIVDGEPRIISDPPLIVPIEELLPEMQSEQLYGVLTGMLRAYRRTLQSDRRHLLEQFRLVQVARKVVGVGSVGTRAWIVLLLGRDGADPLFLQAKEAQPSVLARFVGKSQYANEGQRVVAGQRIMQASSDIFLGWERA